MNLFLSPKFKLKPNRRNYILWEIVSMYKKLTIDVKLGIVVFKSIYTRLYVFIVYFKLHITKKNSISISSRQADHNLLVTKQR